MTPMDLDGILRDDPPIRAIAPLASVAIASWCTRLVARG